MKKFLLVVLALMLLSSIALSAKVESPATPRTQSSSREPGDTCDEALPYLNINDPAVTGSTLEAYDEVWYEFVLDMDYYDVEVSLAGSTFDTKLEVWDECDDATYLGYNDDYYGVQSALFWDVLPAGTYYARVYGYSTSYGDYVLTITGGGPPEFGNLDGTVTDLDTGAPLEGATVTVGTLSMLTDAAGYYYFADVETGIYNVTAAYAGYFNGAAPGLEILAGQTVTQDFALELFDPIGDTIEDPIIIDAFPYFMSGDISLYTDYSTGAGLVGSRSGEDVYFMFELDGPATMQLHSCGSEFDTYLHLYDSNLARIAYNDDGCSSWGSGSGAASWIADTVIPAGTYYIGHEGYSTYHPNPYFEVHFDLLPPPDMGSLDGTITDFGTGLPIEGTVVTAGGFSQTTDAAGYYYFESLETGFYDVVATAYGYTTYTEFGVEILAGQTTTVDIALEVFETAGTSCADPYIIDSVPFIQTGMTTEGYGDDYNSTMACTSSYMNGDDFVFSYTPTENMSLDITLTNTATWVGLFVIQGFVDDPGAVCIASATGYAGNPFLEEVIMTMGNTYYIVISTYPAPQFTAFDISIEANEPPTFGNLQGTVTALDGGAAIEGAIVSAGGLQEITDAAGYYLFENLESGLYTVTATAEGYLPASELNVEVSENETTTVNFALEVFSDIGNTIDNPIVIDAFPYFMSGDISLYTDDSTALGLVGSHSGEDIWFMFELDTPGTMELHSCGSEFDTYMNLYDSNYTRVAYDDDGCSTWGSGNTMASWIGQDDLSYTVVVPAGTYYICHEGYSTYHPNPYYEVHFDLLPPPDMGSLEGTVTDAFSGDPVSGALVTCGESMGMTDATGYYMIPDILTGAYDAYCTNPRYIGAMAPVTIIVDEVATQDFALDINMLPPLNLTATVNNYDIGLEWTAPNFLPADALHWDNMTNADAIGMASGGTFTVAARFTPAELSVYDGMIMDNVTVYINDLPDVMTLYVWSGDNAANVVLEQGYTPTGMAWNNIELNTPVMIDASQELWIGYYVSFTDVNPYPAGCDAGPAVSEYGDLLSEDGGVTWGSMNLLYGLNYNWNIWGVISGDRNEDLILAQPKTWNPTPIEVDSRVEFSLAGIGESVRDFTGNYKVYKDNVLLATVTETTYNDPGLDAGIYEYYVTTEYDEGESPESNHVIVELGTVDVSVTPTELSETLDYGLTSDHTITLSNDGDANFYWAGSIQEQVRNSPIVAKPIPADLISDDADVTPNHTQKYEVPETRDMWDLLDTFIADPTIVSQAGIEFDGTYFYTAVWASALINKFDIDGNFIETFSIPGVSGLRDLAYDGQYFYGGAASNSIWQMDFETQTLVSTIASPVAVRAIAYDDDNDAFWVNNWSTDITLVGRDGSIMDSFAIGTVWVSLYGLAYDNYSDGGPYLYGFSQGGLGDQCVIVQYNIATGLETGVIHDVLEDVGAVGDIAGGLFTSLDYADGTFVIGSLNQSSYTVAIYELCPANSWLAIDPANGTLAPGASVNITATFNAIELPGLTYFADIVFTDGDASAVVSADLTITGSIPTAEITVDPMEFDVMVPVDGMADYDLSIGNLGDLDLEYEAEIIYYEGRAVAEVMPQSVDYWTGSTDGAAFTANSAVNAIDTQNGWMMFDVSGIPDGAIINSIEANVYVNDTYFPYWSLTPCTLDPLTTAAATLQQHIIAGNPSGIAYSYNNESSTFVPGWYMYPLGTTANADMQAALSNDWFAVGASPRDAGTTYYTLIDGWNEANPPYLVVDYTIPINPWVTFGGDMMVDGVVSVGAGADMHTLNFDATGLVDGDVMMGEIMITSNDLYNTEIIVPITMTVGAAYMYGDVTGDEIVDAFDAANILQFTVGMNPVGAPLPWTWELIAGDVDGNGDPEAYDAALVLQYAVGMITEFPVEARIETPAAEVTMTVENGELVFSTTGDLYGFSVSTETDLISFNEPVVDYLHAVNGNALALANAEAISGEFLRIPFEKLAESGEFVMTVTSNGISAENTYYVEDLESVPVVNAVLGNYPNPFNPSTTIALAVANDNTPVKVSIYNVKGQLVNSLVNETVAGGTYYFEWSGKDNSNRPVSSGVYFYKVKIGELNETHKMIMLK
ncbi:MAG: carboxypeptidase regulatory-like domain-containing protein [Candidatus Cloacimonetes bacterium]|nr:carboxypeptidase regulatory-like domain-containing protein [Candidatus Cloacimonadota bacterium]